MERPVEMVKVKKPMRNDITPANREQNSLGGKTRSFIGEMQRSLGQRKNCSTRCPMFDGCPVGMMALSFINPKTKEKGRCLMKQMSPEVQNQFFNLFLSGEEGVIKAIKDALFAYLTDVNAYGTIRDKKDLVDVLVNFYKIIYTSPRGIAKVKEPLTITIRRVGFEPQEMKILPNEPLPDGVRIDKLMAPENDDITEGDPESLMTSPVLERIVKREPVMEEIKIETNVERFLGDDDGEQ